MIWNCHLRVFTLFTRFNSLLFFSFFLPFLLTVLFLFSGFFLFLFVTVSDKPLPLVKMVERLRTRYGRGIESRVSHAACTRGASRVTRVARARGRERDCRWPRVGRARRFKLDWAARSVDRSRPQRQRRLADAGWGSARAPRQCESEIVKRSDDGTFKNLYNNDLTTEGIARVIFTKPPSTLLMLSCSLFFFSIYLLRFCSRVRLCRYVAPAIANSFTPFLFPLFLSFSFCVCSSNIPLYFLRYLLFSPPSSLDCSLSSLRETMFFIFYVWSYPFACTAVRHLLNCLEVLSLLLFLFFPS